MLPLQSLPLLLFAADIAVASAVVTLGRGDQQLPLLLLLPLQSLPLLLFAADVAVATAVVTLATLHLRPPKALPADVWLTLCWLLPLPLLLCLLCLIWPPTALRPLKARPACGQLSAES